MNRTWLAWLGVPLLAGCLFGGIPNEIDEADLAVAAARVICDRIEQCDRGGFESAYFGMRDCRDEWEVVMDLTVEGASDVGCDYDAVGAGEALQDIADMECENFHEGEWLEGYDLIWPDCIL